MSSIKILFVCTGNICRSPTAEAVFRHRVKEAGIDDVVHIASAGTHDYHVGDRPDPRSQAAALRRRYDMSRQRARHLKRGDYETFDYLLVMDRGHLSLLLNESPVEQRHKIRLFMDFAPHLGEREVPDPYYGSGEGFERVLDLIEAAADGLLRHITEEVGRRGL